MAFCAVGCPTSEELRAFRLGEMPPESVDAFAEHLETCPGCESSLATQVAASDQLVEALRSIGSHRLVREVVRQME